MQNKPLAAAGCMLGAMFIISIIDQYMPVIAESSSLWTFHVIRSIMMWAIALVFVAVRGVPLRVNAWRGLAARSVVLSTAMMIYFGALAFMPVAQAAAGLFTSPIWVLVFSVLFFGLRIGPWRVVAVAIGFSGTMMVLAPDPSDISWVALTPILAGAIYAVSAIATREWCPREGALELALGGFAAMIVWGVVGIATVSLLQPAAPDGADGFILRGWVWPNGTVWFWITIQAVFSLIAVVLMTRAYQLAEASYVGVFEYSQLGFAAFFGYLVWSHSLGVMGYIGIAAIAFAGSLIALRGRSAG